MERRDRRVNVVSHISLVLALALGAGAWAAPASAQPGFPKIPLWAFPGAFQDSSLFNRFRCVGSFGPMADSIREQARTISLRFHRDRRAEARPDFAGYRIWRVTGTPDTGQMVLIRRFSLNTNAALSWNFSVID